MIIFIVVYVAQLALFLSQTYYSERINWSSLVLMEATNNKNVNVQFMLPKVMEFCLLNLANIFIAKAPQKKIIVILPRTQ